MWCGVEARCYISVEIVDEAGNVVPNMDDVLVKYQISVNGSIAGVGNGNLRDMSSFQKPEKQYSKAEAWLLFARLKKREKLR
ncbi:hypothetical protein [Runella salmonicolor]|uniref:Glycoside hydrolase family 2 domain-containing protein n=1 Tax=Runella salmonicolor TaxID=2950278 RepID=A0ABT1FHN4_9BACT|nr:hypothetical protein [Runella salmonicolor]MCP1381276.1 hypothetical protein [Runella salmonicolor]